MKIRNGFVSNSSSSSFIVAVAKVVNKKALNSWLSTLKIKDYYYKVCTIRDILDGKCYDVAIDNGEVIVHSFSDSARLDVINLEDNDKVFYVNIINDEGDTGIFSGYNSYTDEYVGIDYDIDLDDFSDEQIELYDGLGENNGLAYVDKKYGAGRNG